VSFILGNRTAETPEHSLIKHIIASILERNGHKVHLEVECPDGSIVDVFAEDKDNDGFGVVYEVQTKKQEEIEKEKLKKYKNFAMVRDIIFIRTKEFDMSKIINSEAYKKLKYKLLGD